MTNVWFISEEEFQSMQHDFLEKYYNEFEDTEENKFIYTDIHREYVSSCCLQSNFKECGFYLIHNSNNFLLLHGDLLQKRHYGLIQKKIIHTKLNDTVKGRSKIIYYTYIIELMMISVPNKTT